MSLIYISCVRKEGHISEKLESQLQETGFQTWRDSQHITPSGDFHHDIQSALKKASHFLICLSEGADLRPEGMEQLEISYALA